MALRLFFFLLLVSLLTSYRAQAQAYEPGLLVRANGDTLRGEIENGFWDEPPMFIRFRATATGPSTVFQPCQLRAVSFTKGRYFRYEALPIDHAAETRLNMLGPGLPHNVRIDSLLAEVLVEGPTMLWRVAGQGSVHFLVRRPGQPILTLSSYRYLRTTARGNTAVADGNNYRNQLQQYFRDCPAAVAAATGAAYTTAGLVAVVQTYYSACSAGQPAGRTWQAPSRTGRAVAFQAGALAGARYNRIESQSSALAGSCSDCAVHPFAGFYAELLLPSRTSAFYGELSVSPFANRGVAVYYPNSYVAFSYRAWLGTARAGLRFFKPLAHDQLLLFTFGLEYNKVFGTSTPVTSEDLGYASPTLLPNIGVGWRRQRFTLNLDGQCYISHYGTGVSDIFVGSNVAVRLGLGYRLGRAADAPRPARATRP